MKMKTIKKPFLQRLLKTKYSKKQLQTTDNKKVIQEQDCSATHLKEIVKDVKHKQHRAAVDTHDFHSPSKSPKLHLRTQCTSRVHSADFDTPTPLMTENLSDN